MTDTPENNDQAEQAVETVAERPRKTLTLGGSRAAAVEPTPEPEVEIEAVAEIVNDDTGVDTTAD
ncbi:MAG: transcription termination factor Rho, partial [Brevundimonas sp.]